jgi:hypothetical protein
VEEASLRFCETQALPNLSEVGEFDDMREVLYERALEESIESLGRILERVRVAVGNGGGSFVEYKKSVQRAIFTK